MCLSTRHTPLSGSSSCSRTPTPPLYSRRPSSKTGSPHSETDCRSSTSMLYSTWWQDLPQNNPDPHTVELKPGHLAYVIYTFRIYR